MNNESKLLVGIDLCDDYTQLAYYNRKTLSPESVCRTAGEEEYLIPTKLALKVKKHEWVIGEEALEALQAEEEVIEAEDFLSGAKEGKVFEVGGTSYSAGHLMQIFIRRALHILHTYYPYNDISHIVFTFEQVTKEVVTMMAEATERLDMKGKYSILSHDEAFLYYTINQRRELFINDTAKFELNEDGMHFGVLEIDKSSVPMIAKIEKKYVSENLNRSMLKEDKGAAEIIFSNLSMMALEGRFISTVYAVGRGFADDWGDAVLLKLAPGRHVFRGQNLFVKGACFLAKEKTSEKESDILFLGEDRIAAGVSVIAVKDGKEEEIVLVDPTLKWYEADVTMDLLIRGEDELSIQMKDFLTKKITKKFLSLSGINLTNNELSRIRLHIRFTDKNTCIIKATDLGFGSFVPTTNRVWELTWEK